MISSPTSSPTPTHTSEGQSVLSLWSTFRLRKEAALDEAVTSATDPPSPASSLLDSVRKSRRDRLENRALRHPEPIVLALTSPTRSPPPPPTPLSPKPARSAPPRPPSPSSSVGSTSTALRRRAPPPPPGPGAIVAASAAPAASKGAAPAQPSHEELHFTEIFGQLDRNSDGAVTPREIILALRKRPSLAAELHISAETHEGASRDALMAYFHALDKNQDDEVSLQEFVDFHVRRRGERKKEEGRKEAAQRGQMEAAAARGREARKREQAANAAQHLALPATAAEEAADHLDAAREVAAVSGRFSANAGSRGRQALERLEREAFELSNESRVKVQRAPDWSS